MLRVCSSQCIAASIVLDPLHNHCINTHVHKKARTSTHTHMHIVHMKRYFERWRDYFTPVFVELKHLSKHTTLTSSIHVCRATSLLAPHPAPLVVTARSKSTSIVLRLTWLGGYVHGSAFKNLLLLSNTYTHMHIIYPCTRKVMLFWVVSGYAHLLINVMDYHTCMDMRTQIHTNCLYLIDAAI